jgi:L,D-transpeptidase YcbB
MRVEQPTELALWALRDEPDWPRERIEAAMNGTDTIRIELKSPIPVLIVYGTAVALETGQVRFLEDLYGYDAALAKRLARITRR